MDAARLEKQRKRIETLQRLRRKSDELIARSRKIQAQVAAILKDTEGCEHVDADGNSSLGGSDASGDRWCSYCDR